MHHASLENNDHIARVDKTRSSAVAETPARRSVSVEMLAYCRTTNANRSHVSMRSTFSVLLRSCLVYTRIVAVVSTRLPHSEHAMLRVT